MRALAWILFSVAVQSALARHPGNTQQPLQASFDSADGVNAGQDGDRKDLEDYIKGLLKDWHIPGLAIAIIDGNETWAKGFGYANLEDSTPVTPETLFFTGSTTKSFTAAALSLLVDESNSSVPVSWDTPVSSLLRDDFVLSDEWATNHITIEDALSHRTGYPRHDLSRWVATPRETVRKLRDLPLSASPRTKFQYCNLMFAAMGYLVEVLSGTSLSAFFHERLWGPWEMNSTFLSVDEVNDSGLGHILAREYLYNNDSDTYIIVPYANMTSIPGAGSTISNVLDYSRYLRAMMNEAGPVSKAGHAALKTPRSLMQASELLSTGPTWYSLGWMGGVFENEQFFYHGGQVDSFVSHMLMAPGRKFGIVTMLNAPSGAQNVLWAKVAYDYFGVPEEKRVPLEELVRKRDKEAELELGNCRSLTYPHVPHPPLPLPLSLANYTGEYQSAGYGRFNLALDCEKQELPEDSPAVPTTDADGCRLTSYAVGSAAPGLLAQLQHVSGDFWIGWAYLSDRIDAGYRRPAGCVRVQTEVGPDGAVKRIGADLRLEGPDTPLVWFDRVN